MKKLYISSAKRWQSDFLYNKYYDVFKDAISIHYVLHSLIDDLKECGDYVAYDVIKRLREITPDKELYNDYLIAAIILDYSKISIDSKSVLFRLDFLLDLLFAYPNDKEWMEKIIRAMSHPDTAYIGRNINMSVLKHNLHTYLNDRDADEGQFLLLDLYCGRII